MKMEWKDIFPSHHKPTMEEIADYIGGEAKELWGGLMQYMGEAYKAKPTLAYSVCSGKPGWNIKFQKSGQSFGTLYPEENSFSVFLVISYKLLPLMEDILPSLSRETAELFRQSGDYMKLGRWMMFRITDKTGVEDYKRLISVKMKPSAV
jgi:hypothetical protein